MSERPDSQTARLDEAGETSNRHCSVVAKDLASLRRIGELYPAYYSQKRLQEWRALFHDQAIVIRLKHGSDPRVQAIDDAMPEQIEYAAENSLLIETWQHVDIDLFGTTATIKAHYTLEADHETRKGVDLLTLTKSAAESSPTAGGTWKIISLIYEEHECTAKNNP